MALPKVNRLARFSTDLFLNAKKIHTSNLVVLFKNSDSVNQCPQFSISVGKKISKKAVARNNVRRQISNTISQLLQLFPTGRYLIIPKAAILNLTQQDILNEMKEAIVKLNKFK